MNGGMRGPMSVPDPAAMAAQSKVIEAQKELEAIKFAQGVRQSKAQNAINFLLLPMQDEKGMKRQEPELDDPEIATHCRAARAAAYDFLAGYFSTTTDFEAGVAVHESPDKDLALA